MKIKFSCPKCYVVENPKDVFDVELEMRDDGIYELKCARKHKSKIYTSIPKFEVLYYLGSKAYWEGYYFEAVATFAASLERFHEFCIEALLLMKGIDHQKIFDTWKTMKNQSERQIGAFYFLYLSELDKEPQNIQKLKSLRNDVFHQGKIPTSNETLKYGEDVLKYIFEVVKNMNDKMGTKFRKAIFKLINQNNQKLSESHLTQVIFPSIINISKLITDSDSSFGKEKLKDSENIFKKTPFQVTGSISKLK